MTLALRVPDCVVYMDEQQRVNIGLMRGPATLGVEFAFCAVLIAWAGFVLSQIGVAQRMPPLIEPAAVPCPCSPTHRRGC